MIFFDYFQRVRNLIPRLKKWENLMPGRRDFSGAWCICRTSPLTTFALSRPGNARPPFRFPAANPTPTILRTDVDQLAYDRNLVRRDADRVRETTLARVERAARHQLRRTAIEAL